ncbi:MAG: hypothetical protein H6510_16735 [Acidobacteria bacterium]|nr:hypothetical protein [Acidobacteriota bacterium]MCB9399462.1 hypothetical protein [Acidobacteriota bacterium]
MKRSLLLLLFGACVCAQVLIADLNPDHEPWPNGGTLYQFRPDWQVFSNQVLWTWSESGDFVPFSKRRYYWYDRVGDREVAFINGLVRLQGEQEIPISNSYKVLSVENSKIWFLRENGNTYELMLFDNQIDQLETLLTYPKTTRFTWFRFQGQRYVTVGNQWIRLGQTAQTNQVVMTSASTVFRTVPADNYIFWDSDGNNFYFTNLTSATSTSVNSGMSIPSIYAVMGDKLFFLSEWVSPLRSLKVMDPVSQTLTVLSTSNPVSSGSQFFVLGNRVFFSAELSPGNRELFVSDGTLTGTGLFKNISTAGSSSPQLKGVINGRLVFTAINHSNGWGRELWASDGTPEGTIPLIDSVPGPNLTDDIALAFAGNRFVFTSEGQLFYSDATPAGTAPATFLPADQGSSSGGMAHKAGPVVLLNANLISRLLVTEGNPGDVIDLINPFYTPTLKFAGMPGAIQVEQNDMLYQFDSDFNKTLLGTKSDHQIYPIALNNRLLNYFRPDGLNKGFYASDADLNHVNLIPYLPSDKPLEAVKVGSRTFFRMSFAGSADRLWITDGTPAGTSRILLDRDGHDLLNVNHLVAFRNGVIFSSDSMTYFSDGTSNNTFQLFAGNFDYFHVMEDQCFLRTSGWQWITPHFEVFPAVDFWPLINNFWSITHAGTQLIGVNGLELVNTATGETLFPGKYTLDILGPAPSHPELALFVAESNFYGRELFATDGTIGGTLRLTDYNPGPFDSFSIGANQLAWLDDYRAIGFLNAHNSGLEPHLLDFSPLTLPSALRSAILPFADTNLDGLIDGIEAARVRELVLSDLALLDLDWLPLFPNLERLEVHHCQIRNVAGLVNHAIGSRWNHSVDLNQNGLTPQHCADLTLIRTRFESSGATLLFDQQGNTQMPPSLDTWTQPYTILDFLNGIFLPPYTLNCP